jgi:Tfp pilus assembly protein PilF
LAESYLRAGTELPQAKVLAVKAVKLEPAASNYGLLAAVCEQQGDIRTACSSLEKAIALEPDSPHYRKAYESLKGKK